MSGSTRDCDRSTVGLEITSPVVVRVVSSELPDGGGGVRSKRGSTSCSVSCGGSCMTLFTHRRSSFDSVGRLSRT